MEVLDTTPRVTATLETNHEGFPALRRLTVPTWANIPPAPCAEDFRPGEAELG
jgi:hypothetical protein